MNNKSILLLSLCLLGFASCSNKMEFKTADYVTFSSNKYTVKEDAGQIKIPVDIFSNRTIHTTVTYTVTKGDGFAVPGEDYTIDGTGVLNITNAKDEVSDSIVIKPVSKVGELQGNKTIEIVLNEVTEDGLYKGSTSTCTVKIIDIDGGVNLIVGNWTGTGLESNNNPASLDLTFDVVEEGDEALELYPTANLKILSGSKMLDPVGNTWTTGVDLYAYFDEETSELHIFPHQCFEGGNFGDPVGVAYAAIDVKATLQGTDTDVVFYVEDGVMTLSDDVYFALYAGADGTDYTGYVCGYIKAGAEVVKN